MRLLLPTLLVAVIAVVECNHTFMGSNVQRPLVHQHTATYSSYRYQKRVETYSYTMPPRRRNSGMVIQGILAYDLTNTSASANVTSGGVGYPYMTLRMKSDRGESLKYQIYPKFHNDGSLKPTSLARVNIILVDH
ncbi:uncharacterized protein [Epargyreus clarus]|uniref:uncharacterized protein n=1 Tax=Epargyreus clarus TaxID=520877 RepID=UPI003C2F344D